ncbi:MAG: UDP-N-acetylglucosamine 2-epimerase (hydrolyzing) [Lachnospiraceae bacterium]|nr:UDP-N-acetylglucosamine 2-epimerase (hydrolyzing) [Lachnospiraceae bacterium]
MKKICVITATRAEYGLLKPLVKQLMRTPGLETQLVATGAHLVESLGNTWQEIEKDNIGIYKKIPIQSQGDESYHATLTMANALVQFGKYFQEEKPDLLVVLGDRTELLAFCAAAVNEHIPIAHIHGGELTQGAVDDSIRHAVTKMSYLHFTSTEEYRKRVIQMGEEPGRVYHVGALGVENILNEELLSRELLECAAGFPASQDYAVVTFHPVTLEPDTAIGQVKELFAAMQAKPELFYLITKANADAGGRAINEFMEHMSANCPNMKLVASLGVKRYLSAVKYARFVLGNSSSGIIEAPSLGVPTVNIGDRQKGRIMAGSVLCCEPEKKRILAAMEQAMHMAGGRWENPYGDGGTSRKIVSVLKGWLEEGRIDLKKKFYDIPWNGDKL